MTNGQQYARLAPKVPHARHMLGHDLRRVGRVDDAIVEFEAADQLSRDYFQRENVPAEFDWHYHHNLDLLGTSYAYRGEMKKAAGLLQRAFALPTNLVGQAVNKREWPRFLLARGRVEDSLAAARTLVAHPHPVVQAIGRIEAGYALLATGQYAATSTEANAALRLLRAGAEGGGLATSAFEGLQGELFLRTGQREKGRQFLLQAAAKWRAAPGPDAWSEALFRLEAMARVARDVGDWEFADVVSRQMLDHDDAYAGSHYAAALVAEQSGDAAGARAAFARAIKGWSHADADLPELAVARRNR